MLTVNIVMIILRTSYVLLAWLYYISYILFIMYTRVHSVQLHYIIIIIIATVSIRRTYNNYNWQVCTIYYSRVRYIVYVYNIYTCCYIIIIYIYVCVYTLHHVNSQWFMTSIYTYYTCSNYGYLILIDRRSDVLRCVFGGTCTRRVPEA